MSDADFRQQQEVEEERQREALDVLNRVMWYQVTSADLLYLAHELGVSKQFEQDIVSKRRAA